MIQYPTTNGQKCFLIEDVSELPDISNKTDLYCDFETTSFIDKEPAFNPYRQQGGDKQGSRISGIAMSYDNADIAFYVPIRSRSLLDINKNLPVDKVISWLASGITTCKRWINHNVKFDAHFLLAEGVVVPNEVEMIDTVVLAKLIDSDRLFKGKTYDLGNLSADWLKEDISSYEQEITAYLKGMGKGIKDYGLIPIILLGKYACMDIHSNRALYYYCLNMRPDTVKPIWNIETKLTPVLYDMERKGLKVNHDELKMKQCETVIELIDIHEQIHKIIGRNFNPTSNAECHDLLCTHFNLPVLGWTEEDDDGFDDNNLIQNTPSFSKKVLKRYLTHPSVLTNSSALNAVKAIEKYRKRSMFLNLFVDKFLELSDENSIIHPTYNQLVRTGRTSSRNPNSQQNTKESKSLVKPHDSDRALLSSDGSQMEFRLIAHYTKQPSIIKAYAEDPMTDFHTVVAKLCGISRKPAKNVNFCVAFGGGQEKVLSMLEAESELTEHILKTESRPDKIKQKCRERAVEVYNTYHSMMSNLKPATRIAAMILKTHGHVVNAYGRRRHMNEKAAFRSFNSIVQGLASDIIKGNMISMAPRYNSWMRDRDINLIGLVHDEILYDIPKDLSEDKYVHATIVRNYEVPLVPLRIPLRFSCAVSAKDWMHANEEGPNKEKWKFEEVGFGEVKIDREIEIPDFTKKLSDYDY